MLTSLKMAAAQLLCGFSLLFAPHARATLAPWTIPLPLPIGSSGMPLKVFITSSSVWDDSAVLAEMRQVNQIFSRCGFGFSEIEINSIETNTPSFDKSEVADLVKATDRESKRFAQELSLFFIKQVHGRLAKVSPLGVSWGRKDSVAKSYANFAVITDRALKIKNQHYYSEDYSILAHELGHILLNTNHVDFKNLMAGQVALLDGSLTSEQCRQINSDPYGLLAKTRKSSNLAAHAN